MIYVVASLPYNVCTFIERYILYVALTYSRRRYSVYGTRLKVLDSAVSHIHTKVKIVYLLLNNALTEGSVQTELDSFMMKRCNWATMARKMSAKYER